MRLRIARIVVGTDGSASAEAAERILASLPIAGSGPGQRRQRRRVVRPLAAGIAPTLYANALAWQVEHEAEGLRSAIPGPVKA